MSHPPRRAFILWDWDNVKVKDSDLVRFYSNLAEQLVKDKFTPERQMISAFVFGNYQSFANEKVRRTLLTTLAVQCCLVDETKPEAADKALVVKMSDCMEHWQDASLVVISNDKGFIPNCKSYVMHHRKVAVVHNYDKNGRDAQALSLSTTCCYSLGDLTQELSQTPAPTRNTHRDPKEPHKQATPPQVASGNTQPSVKQQQQASAPNTWKPSSKKEAPPPPPPPPAPASVKHQQQASAPKVFRPGSKKEAPPPPPPPAPAPAPPTPSKSVSEKPKKKKTWDAEAGLAPLTRELQSGEPPFDPNTVWLLLFFQDGFEVPKTLFSELEQCVEAGADQVLRVGKKQDWWWRWMRMALPQPPSPCVVLFLPVRRVALPLEVSPLARKGLVLSLLHNTHLANTVLDPPEMSHFPCVGQHRHSSQAVPRFGNEVFTQLRDLESEFRHGRPPTDSGTLWLLFFIQEGQCISPELNAEVDRCIELGVKRVLRVGKELHWWWRWLHSVKGAGWTTPCVALFLPTQRLARISPVSPPKPGSIVDLLRAINKLNTELDPPEMASFPRAARTFASPEQLKLEGNDLLRQGKYQEAILKYSKAIEIEPSHICYANRAAAYTHLNDYSNAASDAATAVQINPGYAKAWSRLGTAHFYMQKLGSAIDAFTQAVELDPTNESYKSDLASAKAMRL